MDELEKILTLENEVIAGLLESILQERNIPHLIRSFHDSAYDGLFTMHRGWGIIEAAPEHKDAILEIYRELKEQQG